MKSLFFFIWLSQAMLFSHKAVHKTLSAHPGMKTCTYNIVTLGKSHKGNDIKAWHIPGKKKEVVYVFGSIHGDEKAGAVLAVNLLVNLCAAVNKQTYSALVVPVANPDGFDRRRGYGRGNGRFKDLNRDAFNRREKESKALYRGFTDYKVVRFVDVHMTGNHVQWPRPWTRAHDASKRFQKRLKKLGLKWWARHGHPYGMWFSMASERGIPAVLFEIGKRRDHLKYHRGHYFKLVWKPLLALFRIFFEKNLPMPKDLRKGKAFDRIKRHEKNKWRRRDRGLRRHLRPILPGRPVKKR